MERKHWIAIAVVGVVGAGIFSVSRAGSSPRIKSDERIVFFDTAARPGAGGKSWIVPIHGWVYEPEESRLRKGVIAEVLEARYGLEVTERTRSSFDRRVNLFLSDNERGKRVKVRLGEREVTLPPSAPDGHFRAEVQLPAGEATRLARGGWIELQAVLPAGDERRFKGRARLDGARGIAVISDIDDTVKVTGVRDRKTMLSRTFLEDFEPVEGMAKLYSAWAKAGASLHFVSSSPWYLHEPLREFLEKAGFPRAPLHLKSFRFRDRTFFDLFAPGRRTKPAQIEPILAAWPERTFVLVGDSGEEDPETYAAILREHPGRIARIYIRNVTGEKRAGERLRKAFAGVPAEKWMLFTKPLEIALPE